MARPPVRADSDPLDVRTDLSRRHAAFSTYGVRRGRLTVILRTLLVVGYQYTRFCSFLHGNGSCCSIHFRRCSISATLITRFGSYMLEAASGGHLRCRDKRSAAVEDTEVFFFHPCCMALYQGRSLTTILAWHQPIHLHDNGPYIVLF
jgi:hypothetical protein